MKKITAYVLMFLIATSIASAIDIGLSPSTMNFNKMLKGGYAKKTVTVSTSSAENVTGHIEVVGTIKPWLSFEPTNDSFTFSKTNPLRFSVISMPPNDVANGDYEGAVRFVTDSVGTLSGSGSLIKAAVELGISNQITGEQIFSCNAGGFRVTDIEPNKPLGVWVTVLNDGNIRITPTITLDIWDQAQKQLLVHKESLTTELLPTLEGSYFREIEVNLPEGQYWVLLGVKGCPQTELATFSVVGKGEISDKGRLIEILTDRFVATASPMQIKARFENQGMRSVTAKFMGEVRMGKKLISAIESAPAIVDPNQVVELIAPFTPDQPGQYTVTGRVIYNEKYSFESSNEFEAIGDAKTNISTIAMYATVYILIMALILFLIFKIRRKKKGHHY